MREQPGLRVPARGRKWRQGTDEEPAAPMHGRQEILWLLKCVMMLLAEPGLASFFWVSLPRDQELGALGRVSASLGLVGTELLWRCCPQENPEILQPSWP